MQWTAKFVWSLILLVLGVIVYVAAVSGALFPEGTPPTDVGIYAVTVVFVAFGAFGLYVARREQKEQRESEEP